VRARARKGPESTTFKRNQHDRLWGFFSSYNNAFAWSQEIRKRLYFDRNGIVPNGRDIHRYASAAGKTCGSDAYRDCF
jgi:hypothetical protein